MRVAIVKPDWRIRGGFELVVDRIIDHLLAGGHRIDVLGFDAWRTDHRPFGVRVDDESWAKAPAYFTYLAHVEKVASLDVGRADLVISTQPPSFTVRHPRHLSVFFHHLRPFYDLSPYMERAGMVEPEMHAHAATAIRRIDDAALNEIGHVLAGSETVAGRLATFNARTDRISVFHAGPTAGSLDTTSPRGDGQHVLCVSRHDFPKRTELFVHGARLAPEVPAIAVGRGGRLGWLRGLDAEFDRDGVPDVMADTDLWLNEVPWIDTGTYEEPAVGRQIRSNVRFQSGVSDARLAELYRHAHCLVAPALLEDYGLTVIEAMAAGIPVVCCSDGGHLVHFVEHERNGLVVEPTGKAIAAAIRRLVADPALRERLGEEGRRSAATITWERAFAEFDAGMAAVMA